MLLDHQGAHDLSVLRQQAGEAEQVNATTENISDSQIILSHSEIWRDFLHSNDVPFREKKKINELIIKKYLQK